MNSIVLKKNGKEITTEANNQRMVGLRALINRMAAFIC
jgi:hypothetical protein